MSARSFSRVLGVADNNTQNYVSDKPAMPKADYLEKVLHHFPGISPAWLLTGNGEPFSDKEPAQTTRVKNTQGQIGQLIGTNHGTATQNSYSIADCEKERDGYKAQLDKALREVELLTSQLQTKDALIAAKDEMLDLLRGGFNRPN